ncbi:MAG: hypothetical protein ACTFAL_14955 [Candidatus Electronema sp. V4]|uniref:hypothetical protein n=1 Tax=Candidatus Electronema sp. V4 TaxID=3454756 RepID=UPI0040556533
MDVEVGDVGHVVFLWMLTIMRLAVQAATISGLAAESQPNLPLRGKLFWLMLKIQGMNFLISISLITL